MSSPLLIGSSFAMLAAAVEIAGNGQEVLMLTDGKPLGGHFAGLQIEGQDFDIGMVLLEECPATDPGADLRSYDPAARNNWTRFGDLASDWIRDKVDLIRAKTPECLVEGRRIPDYLISNRLDGLNACPFPPLLAKSDPRHAAHKYQHGAFDYLTYAEAATWNHGDHWHQRFIEPFVWKVLGVPSTDFLARFHRAAWAPLYYPETLKAASFGDHVGLPEYQFWTTPNGFVGQLVKNLRDALTQMSKVTVITQPLSSLSHQKGAWTCATIDGEVYRSHRLALGLSPERAGALLGVNAATPMPAASVTLLFASVQEDFMSKPHGCTMIVDDAYAAYRLTDQDALAGLSPPWHRIVLEASPQGIAKLHPGKTVETALRDELANLLGVDPKNRPAIRVLRCFTAYNALPIPTPEQVSNANNAAAAFAQAAPGAVLTGSLLGYGVASLNDQLIQGLKISEEFK